MTSAIPKDQFLILFEAAWNFCFIFSHVVGLTMLIRRSTSCEDLSFADFFFKEKNFCQVSNCRSFVSSMNYIGTRKFKLEFIEVLCIVKEMFSTFGLGRLWNMWLILQQMLHVTRLGVKLPKFIYLYPFLESIWLLDIPSPINSLLLFHVYSRSLRMFVIYVILPRKDVLRYLITIHHLIILRKDILLIHTTFNCSCKLYNV